MNRRIPLPSLDALYVFEAAARLGSFKGAAAELSVTATAVSHRIRALEEALACPLFVRQVRAVTLTREGQLLQEAVAGSLDSLAQAVSRICHPERRTVTISVTPEFASQWLIPKLAAFQMECPGIDLRIHASYEPVNIQSGDMDLVVRYGAGLWPQVDATPLFQEFFAPVASPALQKQLSADARQWPLIHFHWQLPSHQAFDWSAWAKAANIDAAQMNSGTHYSDGAHAIRAAIAGQGVAMLGLSLLAEELRLNLLAVVSEPRLPGQFYHVCLPAGRSSSPAVKAVKNWILTLATTQ